MPSVNLSAIGNKLLHVRKELQLTQAEVAGIAGLSDRTYADIERGNVNMRVDTLLRICDALKTTPNDILLEDCSPSSGKVLEILNMLSTCSPDQKDTALKLLDIYLQSLR